MDDVLMLDQEPNSEYDLDEEQRPRFSRVSHSLTLWRVVTIRITIKWLRWCATAVPKVKKHGIPKDDFCTFQLSPYCLVCPSTFQRPPFSNTLCVNFQRH